VRRNGIKEHHLAIGPDLEYTGQKGDRAEERTPIAVHITPIAAYLTPIVIRLATNNPNLCMLKKMELTVHQLL
jgi:hypothetical protein